MWGKEKEGKKQEEEVDQEKQFDEEQRKKLKRQEKVEEVGMLTFAEGAGLLQASGRVGLRGQREERGGRVAFDTVFNGVFI